MLVRPTADIATFPAPGWTTAPLFSKVNSDEPDDSTFITGLAPGAEDPQFALALADLEIPYGATGSIKVRLRLAWSAAPTVSPDALRIGLAPVAALGGSDPALTFERNIVGFVSTEFVEVEVVFNYSDWSGDSSVFGIYLEMTPNSADAIVGNCSWVEVEACTPAQILTRCQLGSLTARELMVEARDWSPAFEKRGHPDAILMRAISSFEKEASNYIAQIRPSMLASTFTVTLPLGDGSPADFEEGITLPAYTYMLPGATLLNLNTDNAGQEIELVNLGVRHRPGDYSSDRLLFLQGKKLFLSGVAATWIGFESLVFRLVLTPAEINDQDQRLLLPNFTHDAYVGAMVKIMAARSKDAASMVIAGEMVQGVWDAIAQQGAAETFVTVDVFPGGF